LRRQVSLLLHHGHSEAHIYPIGMVFDEARLAVDRTNSGLVSMAVIIQAATATTGMGAGRESTSHFRKLMKALGTES